MKKSFAIVSILLIILLSACSPSEQSLHDISFSGGTFYFPNIIDNSDKPIETVIFQSDGTGTLKGKSYSNDFAWKQNEHQIITTFPIFNATCYEYKSEYLINPSYQWNGDVPNRDSFNANLTLESKYNLKVSFQSSGVIEYSVDDETISGTYTRDDEIILALFDNSITREFLVIDGTLYSNYLRPIEKTAS